MNALKLERSEINVLTRALEWQAAEIKVCLITVLKTWGSSPRPVGAVMAINERGHSIGSVSGGCIEEELVEIVRKDFPRSRIFLNFSSENHKRLPCGGQVDLLIEPLINIIDFTKFLEKLKSFDSVSRLINKKNGEPILISEIEASHEYSESHHVLNYPSPWRILIIGAGDLSLSVYKFSSLMGYRVSICDPRKEYVESWLSSESAVNRMMPDDFIMNHKCDSKTAVVALTHDPKIDDLAMIEAVKTDAFYIGALGSTRTAKARAERLMKYFEFSEVQIKRIKAPIGIDFDTKKVDEIALSVMADITSVKNGVSVVTQRTRRKNFGN